MTVTGKNGRKDFLCEKNNLLSVKVMSRLSFLAWAGRQNTAVEKAGGRKLFPCPNLRQWRVVVDCLPTCMLLALFSLPFVVSLKEDAFPTEPGEQEEEGGTASLLHEVEEEEFFLSCGCLQEQNIHHPTRKDRKDWWSLLCR